jgi:hypothetical protein
LAEQGEAADALTDLQNHLDKLDFPGALAALERLEYSERSSNARAV